MSVRKPFARFRTGDEPPSLPLQFGLRHGHDAQGADFLGDPRRINFVGCPVQLASLCVDDDMELAGEAQVCGLRGDRLRAGDARQMCTGAGQLPTVPDGNSGSDACIRTGPQANHDEFDLLTIHAGLFQHVIDQAKRVGVRSAFHSFLDLLLSVHVRKDSNAPLSRGELNCQNLHT